MKRCHRALRAFRLPVAALAVAAALQAHAAEPKAPSEAPATEALAGRPAPGTGLARRPDERRPGKGTVVEFFGQPIRLAGEYEGTYDGRFNFDLDRDARANRAKLEQELKFEASLSPRPDLTIFLKLEGDSEVDTWRQSGTKKRQNALERDQAWVFFAGVGGLPLDVQAGRIGLIEPRGWWWDNDLDAVRVFLGNSYWLIEAGLARELAPVALDDDQIAPEHEDRWRAFGRAVWAWRKDHAVGAYWFATRDQSARPALGSRVEDTRADPIDDRLEWLGVRANGDELTAGGHRFGYWLDAARLRGHYWKTDLASAGDHQLVAAGEHLKRVDAGALDVGVLWSLSGPAHPTAWLGWAAGSGDGNDADDHDHNFRQTGLHDNKARFGGVKRFHYYGELFRPELSNLGVASLGLGARFFGNSSVDLVLHDYRQRRASPRLAPNRLGTAPGGVDPHLGRELDLFFAFRETKRLDFTLSLAAFRAGRAYGARAGERAGFAEVGVIWSF